MVSRKHIKTNIEHDDGSNQASQIHKSSSDQSDSHGLQVGGPSEPKRATFPDNIGYVVETICHQTGRMQEVTSCQFCRRQEEVG